MVDFYVLLSKGIQDKQSKKLQKYTEQYVLFCVSFPEHIHTLIHVSTNLKHKRLFSGRIY